MDLTLPHPGSEDRLQSGMEGRFLVRKTPWRVEEKANQLNRKKVGQISLTQASCFTLAHRLSFLAPPFQPAKTVKSHNHKPNQNAKKWTRTLSSLPAPISFPEQKKQRPIGDLLSNIPQHQQLGNNFAKLAINKPRKKRRRRRGVMKITIVTIDCA